jgi:hypothetical protein
MFSIVEQPLTLEHGPKTLCHLNYTKPDRKHVKPYALSEVKPCHNKFIYTFKVRSDDPEERVGSLRIFVTKTGVGIQCFSEWSIKGTGIPAPISKFQIEISLLHIKQTLITNTKIS